MFVAGREARDQWRTPEARVNQRAQCAGALAVHDAHAKQAALPAFRKVLVDQVACLCRAKSVEIELTRDGNLHGLVGFIAGHARMLGALRRQATKNPLSAERVFAHTH